MSALAHKARHEVTLTVTSLLSIVLLSFHLADDIVRGMAPGGIANVVGVLILVVWLQGTLALAGRRSGYVIMFVASLLASLIPLVHMRGSGLVGGAIAGSRGVFFWVWTLLALGVTATYSVILSAQGLWRLRRGSRSAQQHEPQAAVLNRRDGA